jgi:hypothetical protein
MKKIIIALFFSVSLLLSAMAVQGKDISGFSGTESFSFCSDEPQEVRREYVLVDDQWYLVIYYNDGTISWVPINKPPSD